MNVLERFGLELMSTLAQTWDGLLMAIGDYNILFDTLDIAVIAYIIYKVIQIARETRAGQLVRGILLLAALYAGFLCLLGIGRRTMRFVRRARASE